MRFSGPESHYLYVETQDHGFKYALENDPRGLLHLTGRLPITARAEVRPVGTAIRAPGKLADSLVLVKTDSGTWLDHTEALSFWHSRERLAITRRALTGVLLPKLYRYKIYPTILLMLDERVPKQLPETIMTDRGGAFGGIRPNWVKLWETPAAELLELDRRHLMHLVPLMKHTRAEVKEAARRVRDTGDEGQITLFLMLGEKRYDKGELSRWIGLFHNAVVEIGKTTSFGQELMAAGRKEGLEKGIEKGLEKGIQKGRNEGRQEALAEAIRSYVASNYPRLESDQSIARISSLGDLDEVLKRLYRAKSETAVREILSVR